MVRRGERRPGGSRETSDTPSVVSAYAPTAKAPAGIKGTGTSARTQEKLISYGNT